MKSSNIRILALALLTITLFPLLTFGFFYIFENHPLDFFASIFRTKSSIFIEIISGVIAGIVCGILAWKFIISSFMSSVLNKYGNLIKSLQLNIPSIIFVSFCAGIGEELFFRGAIQLYLGIWITAIIFIAIHGYLDPTNWKVSLYGILMTLIIALLGYMTELLGLTSAMLAHSIIDIILFYNLTYYKSPAEQDIKELYELDNHL
jgi:membrane protease YdiL (CAAX protease family)